MKVARLIWVLVVGPVAGGCALPNPYLAEPARMARLEQRAIEALRRGVRYDDLPSVRAQAIESFQEVAPEAGLVDVKVLSAVGSGTISDIIEGIDFCIEVRSC